jgi:hypothetical protein
MKEIAEGPKSGGEAAFLSQRVEDNSFNLGGGYRLDMPAPNHSASKP